MKPDAPVIDLSGLRRFADSEDELRSFMDIFISQAEETLAALREGCEAGDAVWMAAAHKLKGGAGTLGAAQLHELCAKAQEMEAATAAARHVILKNIETAYILVKKEIEQELSACECHSPRQ